MTHPEYHLLPYVSLVFLGGYDLCLNKFFNESATIEFYNIRQSTRPLGIKNTVIGRLTDDASACITTYLGKVNTESKSDYPKLFGYVLRTDPDLSDGSNPGLDYYIESDLMNALRAGAYSTYRLKQGASNRMVYCYLKIWLLNKNQDFWVVVLGTRYLEYSSVFSNMLNMLVGSQHAPHTHPIVSSTISQLKSDGVTIEHARHVKYLNMYFTTWEVLSAATPIVSEVEESTS
jgi:hypothetical protein